MPTSLTAATALMTLPGPTGRPAARKVRAKCIRLASSDPLPADCPPPSRWRGSVPPPACAERAGVRGIDGTASAHHRGGGFGLDLVEKAGSLAALQPGD